MAMEKPPEIPKERDMCSPAVCPRCRKTTWSGCGRHADQVLSGVSQDNAGQAVHLPLTQRTGIREPLRGPTDRRVCRTPHRRLESAWCVSRALDELIGKPPC